MRASSIAGLAVEQLQHFLLEAAVAKRHARQMVEIDELVGRHQRRRADLGEAVALIESNFGSRVPVRIVHLLCLRWDCRVRPTRAV